MSAGRVYRDELVAPPWPPLFPPAVERIRDRMTPQHRVAFDKGWFGACIAPADPNPFPRFTFRRRRSPVAR